MCRADIAPAARPVLSRILADMAQQLADEAGVPADRVRIGPVDFGDHEAVSRP
jgi:hypothetical protein